MANNSSTLGIGNLATPEVLPDTALDDVEAGTAEDDDVVLFVLFVLLEGPVRKKLPAMGLGSPTS